MTIEKSRGRVEIRELWVVPADDLSAYLAAEWGWQGIAQVGWVRRWRNGRPAELWTVEEVTIVTSRPPTTTPPALVLALVRQHWSIENRVHWPRDVSLNEDRLHGRQIGMMLAWLRSMVLNLIRHHLPGTFIPDARSMLATDLRQALQWLHAPLMN